VPDRTSYGASSIGDVVTLSSTSEDCAPKPSKIVYRYSDSGRTMMDSNGNFEQDTFDSEGRITSRSTGEGAGRRTVSYTYDENGLLTGETITKGGKPYSFLEILDENGDWHRDISNPLVYQKEYSYEEFDSHGNWVRRSIRIKAGGKSSFENGGTQTRKITYR